jgi:hypothetical protein
LQNQCLAPCGETLEPGEGYRGKSWGDSGLGKMDGWQTGWRAEG